MKMLLFFLLCPLLLSAQKLNIFGYFEPQYMGAKIGGEFYNIASNKLRFDLAKTMGANVSFGANFDYITFHGKTEWNLLDYLPATIADQIPAALANAFVFHFGDMVQQVGPMAQPRPDRIFLDNAFVKLTFKKLDMTIGKQQLGMGAGYTWNPTDIFNIKNALDPTYEQPGHNAIRMEYSLGPKLSIDSYWAPGERMQDSRAMLKLKSNVGRFDVSALVIQSRWRRSDYMNFIAPFSSYQRRLLGGDFAGELFGLGVWGEGGYTFVDLKDGPGLPSMDDFWEMVFGVDYTFNSGLYVMAEMYHNSQAPNSWQDYSLNDWLWYFSAETKAISRDNLFALVQYPATDLITLGAMVIGSLSDGSAALAPMLTWSLFEDVDLTMYLNYFTGEEGRAYAGNLGDGGLARLRIYF